MKVFDEELIVELIATDNKKRGNDKGVSCGCDNNDQGHQP